MGMAPLEGLAFLPPDTVQQTTRVTGPSCVPIIKLMEQSGGVQERTVPLKPLGSISW